MDWVRAGTQIISLMLGLVVASRQPIPLVTIEELDPSAIYKLACLIEPLSATRSATVSGIIKGLTISKTQSSPTIMPTETQVLRETTPVSPTMTVPTPTIVRVETLNEAMNKFRTEQGLSSLTINDRLCQVIEKRWQELANDFSHTGFEAAVSGLGYTQIAENIWSGTQPSVQQVIQNWQGSSGHNKNMTGSWQFGCGTLKDGKAVYIFMSQ